MANTFFSSDYHFFHENVIKYDNRPFKDVYHMNDEIIRKHNERVKPEDVVYFLGDFGFRASIQKAHRGEGQPYNPKEILKKMNGTDWQFVGGNHDKASNKFNPKTESMVLNQNGLKIKLVHDPKYAEVDYPLNLCGHVHNSWKVKEITYCNRTSLIINVGCCVWDYYPVKLDELLSIYHKWVNERKQLHFWQPAPIIKQLNKGTLCQNREERLLN